MQENEKILREALELLKGEGIVFRNSIGHFTVDRLMALFQEKMGQREPLLVPTEALKAHTYLLGRSRSSTFSVEQKFSEAAEADGMILVVRAKTLPIGAMNEEVDLKGRVIIASAISDQSEEIEEYLGNLQNKHLNPENVVDLAIAYLSNKKAEE